MSEQSYLDLLQDILDNGTDKGDRTGTGTRSLFGRQLRFDLSEGFPALTTKRLFMRGVTEELLWILSGSTDATKLASKKVHIWDEWATEEQCAKFNRKAGDLGPVYGHQWRNFGASSLLLMGNPFQDKPLSSLHEPEQWDNSKRRWINPHYYSDGRDQISDAINLIKTNPNSRRIIVTGWNPSEATSVALPPCHSFFQFYVHGGKLSCHLYQRSADVFLGVPFNIAFYSLLTKMVAQATDLEAGDFVHSFGDVHIYSNHMDQVQEQLSRQPLELPELYLNPDINNIFDFKAEDIKLLNYYHHATIKAPVAI